MFMAYMRDKVTLLRFVGNDQWGEPSPPTAIETRARVEYRSRLIRNAQGEDVMSEAGVYIPSSIMVRHEDRILLSGETGAGREILVISRPSDFRIRVHEIRVV